MVHIPTTTLSLKYDLPDLRECADPLLKEIQADYLSHLIKTKLNPEEQHIYVRYYVEGHTLQMIASDEVMKDEVNYSRIFQKKQNAIRKIALAMIEDATENGNLRLAAALKKSLKKKL